MFSFQAIKHITTCDGGMLAMRDTDLITKAKRIRWFGIDREGEANKPVPGTTIYGRLAISIK
jgi:dTDP-4-amino-4,6-dideoxygalactose transaminase